MCAFMVIAVNDANELGSSDEKLACESNDKTIDVCFLSFFILLIMYFDSYIHVLINFPNSLTGNTIRSIR